MFSKRLLRRGERQRMWLKELKIAIIEKDLVKINDLMDSLPHLQTPQEFDEAQHLIKEALTILQNLKNTTKSSMIQMKKNIEFLRSTEHNASGRLDIKL